MLDKGKSVFFGVSMGLIASMIWGSWPVVSKWAQMQSVSSVEITILRFGVSGLILSPVLFLHSVSLRTFFTKGVVLAVGAGMPYVLLAMEAIRLSTSAHFGIIAPSSMLVFSTLGSIFLLSEKLSRQRILGVFTIVVGVMIVGWHSFALISREVLMGDLMSIGCGALWASFTLLGKYWKLNAWVATAMVSVVSGVLCLPLYILSDDALFVNVSLLALLTHGGFQGVLVAIFALYSYSTSVSILGAAKGAVFAALVPPIAICLGVLILQEAVTWVEMLGIICVFFGMIFALGMTRFSESSR
ncbi:DMT family transporter [Marinomonas sp.]|nr:DMT family transporter [Marinomonas sp.]MDB4837255.1 DMT family transporter [Marinomonas sp.]